MRSLLSNLRRIPTLLRTLRWIRPAQARAQIHHLLVGLPAPVRLRTPPPGLAITVGSTDFLPPPAHVRARKGGSIELLATPFELGAHPNWATQEQGPLFAYHLHQHEYLRTSAFSPAERATILLDWMDRHPSGRGWDPHPISLRLLCWGKLIATQGMLEASESIHERIRASMADQTETLARSLEFRLQANHLLSNLLSMVWSGLLLEGEACARWRAFTPALIAQIEAQIHPDGGHQERSPMYHSLLLESLLDLLNLCRAEPGRAPAGLVDVLESATSRMLVALRVWTHPDRELALFADSGFDVAARPAALLEYATCLGVDPFSAGMESAGSVLLSQSGYLRLVAPQVVLIASTSGPAPSHQPGHAHCDALAFELSLGGHRVITDTGLFEYRPGSRRDRARATAAHSTLQVDGEEQAEIWSAHRIGGRPIVEFVGWDGERTAEASCRGWSRLETIHRRQFHVGAGVATIVDQIEGRCRHLRFCLPIDPAWAVEFDRGSSIARLTLRTFAGRDGHRVEIGLPPEFSWRHEKGAYYPSFGREVERDMLIGEAGSCERATLRVQLLASGVSSGVRRE